MNVEIVDPPTGEVRVRSRLAKGDRLSLEAAPAYVVLSS
jgi:hypothetical protein